MAARPRKTVVPSDFEAKLEAAAAAEKGTPEDPINLEKESVALELAKCDIQSRHDERIRNSDLHGLRKTFLPALFRLAVAWMAAVVVILVLQARLSSDAFENSTSLWVPKFKLSDPVLITFITTTTVNVLGMFIIAAKWLFPTPKEEVSSQKASSKSAKAGAER